MAVLPLAIEYTVELSADPLGWGCGPGWVDCTRTLPEQFQEFVLTMQRLPDYHQACRRLEEVQRVRFYCSKACWRLVEVWRVCFDHRKL